MDAIVLCGNGWRSLGRNDQTLHCAMSREVGRFHPAPWNGAGLPAPLVKQTGQFHGESPLPN